MSFILDALQKSETQRQRQLSPGLATVRRGRIGRAIPVWVPLLSILLIVNIVILAVVMWPAEVTEQGNATSRPAGAALPADDPVQTRAPVPEKRREVRPLAQEASVAAPKNDEPRVAATSTEKQPTAGSVTVMTEQEMNEFLASEKPEAKVDTDRAGSVTELITDENTAQALLPALQELQLRGLIAIPELHLDVHVYGGAASDRFVFVNMKKYREGERLREGPLLESITPQGIILQHNGQRFVLNQD